MSQLTAAHVRLAVAAHWLASHLRAHPILTSLIVPSACRENFFTAVEAYDRANQSHHEVPDVRNGRDRTGECVVGYDEHGPDIPLPAPTMPVAYKDYHPDCGCEYCRAARDLRDDLRRQARRKL